jgi:hypothetical protein
MNNDIIKLYYDKWDKILFSTTSVHQSKIRTIIENAYNFIGIKAPDIYFFQSIYQSKFLIEEVRFSSSNYPFLKGSLKSILLSSMNMTDKDFYSMNGILSLNAKYADRAERFQLLCQLIYKEVLDPLTDKYFFDILSYDFLVTDCWLLDLHINNINYEYNVKAWNIFSSLCKECPYLLAFNDVCIFFEKPSKIELDTEELPHSDGNPAIEFVDGYKIYCNHGIKIPSNYGKMKISDWQAESITYDEELIITEELFFVLFCGIGYKNIYKKVHLPAKQYREKYDTLISFSMNKIVEWQYFHVGGFYRESECKSNKNNAKQLLERLPFKLPKEFYIFHAMHGEEYQMAPGLYSSPLEKRIQSSITNDNGIFTLFQGDQQETYYIVCDDVMRDVSHVYCLVPGREPLVFAECITSFIVAICQCYQEEGYYTSIDELSESITIEQDLNKVELVFEKFNPNQIDNWRQIWKNPSP